jgi:Glycosyl hydrolases family 32 N-terminal domain
MATNEHECTRIRSIRVYACLFLASLLCGCARYADFTLPPPDAAGPRGPFTWSALPEPVIARGEMTDVLNPSLVRRDGGSYFNAYSQYDGKTWTTTTAVSPNGVTWHHNGVKLSPIGWEGDIAANGSVLVVRDEILYWYQAGAPPRIAFGRTKDAIAWVRNPKPVLEAGPLGSFDEVAVADPYVIKVGDYFYLYYLGQDRARRQRLGVARSVDGVKWEKLRSNPILEMGEVGAFDENGLGEPAVWSSGGSYWMLYTGRDRGERRRIGLAKSSDGVHWAREQNFKPIAGDQPWNREVMCDPTVEVLSDQIRVWFGGGDVARPDQNIHGQIGLGFLK